MIMQRKYFNLIWGMALVMLFAACQEEEYALPEAKTQLQNDCIKRTIGPHVAGLNLEFVYAAALGQGQGKLTTMQVDASIAGAAGTYMEHRSFHTNTSGNDVPVEVGNPSVTNGAVTEVTFTRDTMAAALRYYYMIPEEARGRTVSFTFTAKASTGETVTYSMGPYTIAKMEMKRDIVLSDNNMAYFSIADMTAYDAANAAAKAASIDLVYLHRAITGINFNHALVAPAANPDFLPGITLPPGVNKDAKVTRTWALRDQHLARLQYGIFVDDVDFEQLNMSNASNYAINLRAESGAWVETADGKYRAYIYVNSVNNTARTMTVSIKRYQVN
jgi:hypothetical protein